MVARRFGMKISTYRSRLSRLVDLYYPSELLIPADIEQWTERLLIATREVKMQTINFVIMLNLFLMASILTFV